MKKSEVSSLGTQFQKCFSYRQPWYFGSKWKGFMNTSILSHRHVLKGQDLLKLIFTASSWASVCLFNCKCLEIKNISSYLARGVWPWFMLGHQHSHSELLCHQCKCQYSGKINNIWRFYENSSDLMESSKSSVNFENIETSLLRNFH